MDYVFVRDWRGVMRGETVRRFKGDPFTLAPGEVSPLVTEGVVVPNDWEANEWAGEPEPAGAPSALAKMLKAELVKLAEAAGIDSPASLTKAELVAALEAAQEGEHGTGS